VDDYDPPRRAPTGVLYLVVSGAPAPEGAPTLVAACQAAGWRVVVFSTPVGTSFIDLAELERLTGEPVRSEYRLPGTGTSVPPADAVLACPLTFNSVNKFAHGHADNFAVGLLCEMAGYGVPVVVVPHCKPQLAAHPAFGASLETLRSMGVRVLFDPDGCCSIRTRRTSAGCRRGARSSTRSRSGLVQRDSRWPPGRRAADRAGQETAWPVASRARRPGRPVGILAVPGRARQA